MKRVFDSCLCILLYIVGCISFTYTFWVDSYIWICIIVYVLCMCWAEVLSYNLCKDFPKLWTVPRHRAHCLVSLYMLIIFILLFIISICMNDQIKGLITYTVSWMYFFSYRGYRKQYIISKATQLLQE